jgi:hypothetical protein
MSPMHLESQRTLAELDGLDDKSSPPQAEEVQP